MPGAGASEVLDRQITMEVGVVSGGPSDERRGLYRFDYSPYQRGIKRADERTRTADLLITSELLYQLSYVGLLRAQSISQGSQAFTRI
jgi:hypothetical protein